MAFFRRLYRIIAVGAWLAFIIILSIPYQFRGLRGVKKITRLVQLLSKGTARIINLHVKIFGKIHDTAAGLIVSNHQGYIDIVTHGTVFPVRYSPRSDVAKWPLIGWIIGLSNPVWVDRKSKNSSKKALSDFIKTIKHGMHLLVYPEGTSSDGKGGILPFKTASFESAVAENTPVFPVLTRYREIPGRTTVCWYGDMTFIPHIWKVLGFPSIEAELHLLPPVFPEGRSRKELASYVHELMDREYRRIFNGEVINEPVAAQI